MQWCGCMLQVISDTHNKHDQLGRLPDADVLLHCGDSTYRGTAAELSDFNRWLGEQSHIKVRRRGGGMCV